MRRLHWTIRACPPIVAPWEVGVKRALEYVPTGGPGLIAIKNVPTVLTGLIAGVVRYRGFEPLRPVWKTGMLAVEHQHRNVTFAILLSHKGHRINGRYVTNL